MDQHNTGLQTEYSRKVETKYDVWLNLQNHTGPFSKGGKQNYPLDQIKTTCPSFKTYRLGGESNSLSSKLTRENSVPK